MATAVMEGSRATQKDPLAINHLDYVEFYVGNARQAAYWYQHAFGFTPAAYRGPETGHRDAASYLMEQGAIRFVLTTPLYSSSFAAEHVHRHGDGVRDIALCVDDAAAAYCEAVRRGAKGVREPVSVENADGKIVTSEIATYGDTIHTFVERKEYHGTFMPGFVAGPPRWIPSVGLKCVDHCVGNVHLGDMRTYVDFYATVLGFRNVISFDDKDISTEYSALMSKVMASGDGVIKFPINEPAQGRKKSQIDEYLEYYGGAGVQHIALATNDILHTVSSLRQRGVEFLDIPKTYYDDLPRRVGEIHEPVADLAQLGILVDRDEEGYLLQIFTKPVQDRPTVFYEIIQRRGARSFGKGNFKALFEALEREQARRGNL